MGIFDSSFLFLPFGNDLLVVTLVARHHEGWLSYVLAAAVGSTIGVFALALVAQKLGEDGIKKMAGEKRFARLHKMIDKHGSKTVLPRLYCPATVPLHHGDCCRDRAELIAAPNLCRKLFHSWSTVRRSWLTRDQVWETHFRSGQLQCFPVDHDWIHIAMPRGQRIIYLQLDQKCTYGEKARQKSGLISGLIPTDRSSMFPENTT